MVTATGTIRAMVGAEVKVGSRTPGRVEHLAVQVGDVSWGLGLTPPVARSLEMVVQLAGRILGLTLPTARLARKSALGSSSA